MGFITTVLVVGVLLFVLFCVWMEASIAQDRNRTRQFKNECIAQVNKIFGTTFTDLEAEWENEQEIGTKVVSVFIDYVLSRAVVVVKRLSFDRTSGFNRLIGYDLYKCDSSGTISNYGHYSRGDYLDIMRAAGYNFNGEKLENYYYGTNSASGEHFLMLCASKHLMKQCESREFYKDYFE